MDGGDSVGPTLTGVQGWVGQACLVQQPLTAALSYQMCYWYDDQQPPPSSFTSASYSTQSCSLRCQRCFHQQDTTKGCSLWKGAFVLGLFKDIIEIEYPKTKGSQNHWFLLKILAFTFKISLYKKVFFKLPSTRKAHVPLAARFTSFNI